MKPSTTQNRRSDSSTEDSISLAATIKAYFLIQAEDMIDYSELVEGMQRLPGVTSAVQVIGPYDVIAEVAELSKESVESMTSAFANLEGVIRVITVPGASPSVALSGSPRAA